MGLSLTDKILVTGAQGGLGKALVGILKYEGFQFLLIPSKDELNLLNLESLEKYFLAHKPDVVIHLASVVFGLQGNLDNQFRSLSENTRLNDNLFTVISKYSLKNFFFAGTVASYSYPYHEQTLREYSFLSGTPHQGEFGYAMSKRHAYAYLEILRDKIGLDYTYGIFTNLYGENDRFNLIDGHVVPSLIAKSYIAYANTESLNVWGNGEAVRDFLHFRDAAKAILICLKQQGGNGLINISSGCGVKISEVAKIIASAANIKEVLFQKDKPVGIPSRVVDNSAIVSLGFSQEIEINDGLYQLYDWYAKNIDRIRN